MVLFKTLMATFIIQYKLNKSVEMRMNGKISSYKSQPLIHRHQLLVEIRKISNIDRGFLDVSKGSNFQKKKLMG